MLKLRLQYFGHLMRGTDQSEKTLMTKPGEGDEDGEKAREEEDEVVGWYHRLDGHEFDQAPGVGDGQEGLACCSPWGYKELDMTE